MSYFFRFETGMERSLALIPMIVRMKLDTCGVKLTLAQWNKLPEGDRRLLFELQCEDRGQAERYRNLLCTLVRAHAGEGVKLLPLTDDHPWNDLDVVPDQIVRCTKAARLVPPTLEQWRALTPAQRFALVKLTRDGHESPNYLIALEQFSLL